jgi:hypothetical protein
MVREQMKPAPTRDRTRRGRPQLAADVARDRRVVSFLTQTEKAALVALAEERDLSISSLCHELIIEGLARRGEAKNNERGSSELPHGAENA